MTNQKYTLSILAIKRTKQTYVENPDASLVFLIFLNCGIYGTTPPTTIDPTDRNVTISFTIGNNTETKILTCSGSSISFFNLSGRAGQLE